jgi:hypothetical protein
VDRCIGWKKEHPGYDCIFPGVPLPSSESARAFSENQWNQDRKAPVIMGRGMIAGNTPVLQGWWVERNTTVSQNKNLGISIVSLIDPSLGWAF